jgi:hypothetical protein
MWVFTYKFNSDDFLSKYKARLIARDDLKEISIENVYTITLIIKMFRCLMILIFVFYLKTRQFNVINVFLNAKVDRKIHVYMSNEYAIDDKCFLLNRALYNLRKSSLLWLRELSSTLIILTFNYIKSRESSAYDLTITRVIVELSKAHIGQPNPPHWWDRTLYFVQWVG